VAVTLRDVAERAGVSIRSVSNVVNDFHYVSPEMRAKVEAALDDLNYRPNLVARGLRRGRTGIVTLLVPEISVSYFGELAHEIVERASQLGLTVMIDETGGQPQRERALLDVAGRSSWVDGVLFSSEGLTGPALAQVRSDVPVVLLGERTANAAWDHVGIDNVHAARDAVRHLIDSGRRRIAAVGGNATASDITSRLRLKGYRTALREAGLPWDSELYARTGKYARSASAAAVRALLSRAEPPDALFCFSDDLAVGALRELHEQGLRVPADLSVVGFDDVDESRFTTPSLTSVSPRKAEIASIALDLLVQRMTDSGAGPRDVRVGHELTVRESSTRSPAEPAG
jgi:LacI family repressor for deo operon, udp, cdd, tsx, nupC, and nupG